MGGDSRYVLGLVKIVEMAFVCSWISMGYGFVFLVFCFLGVEGLRSWIHSNTEDHSYEVSKRKCALKDHSLMKDQMGYKRSKMVSNNILVESRSRVLL